MYDIIAIFLKEVWSINLSNWGFISTQSFGIDIDFYRKQMRIIIYDRLFCNQGLFDLPLHVSGDKRIIINNKYLITYL